MGSNRIYTITAINGVSIAASGDEEVVIDLNDYKPHHWRFGQEAEDQKNLREWRHANNGMA